jgi:hypothetical protein
MQHCDLALARQQAWLLDPISNQLVLKGGGLQRRLERQRQRRLTTRFEGYAASAASTAGTAAQNDLQCIQVDLAPAVYPPAPTPMHHDDDGGIDDDGGGGGDGGTGGKQSKKAGPIVGGAVFSGVLLSLVVYGIITKGKRRSSSSSSSSSSSRVLTLLSQPFIEHEMGVIHKTSSGAASL